jgi:cytochrome P450
MDAPRDAIAAVTHPDPYPYYAELVARRPLQRDDALGLWVAASAAAVAAVFTSELCRVRPASEPVPTALVGTTAGDVFGRMVRMNDGAYHLRMKPSVSATVAMLDLAVVRRHAETAAQALAAELRPAADAARIAEFAFRLAPSTLGAVLGLAPDALPAVVAAARDFVRGLAAGAGAADVARGAAAARALIEAVRTLPRYRSAGDDAVANVVGFFWQSYEATAALIGNTLVALGTQADVRATVAREPAALAAVVSEVTRWDAPVQNTRRFLVADGEVAGQPMRAGEAVLLVLAAANRDPAANAEPARLDPARRERRVFTFGFGAHACPGEALAVTIASAGVARLLADGVAPERMTATRSYRASANMRMPLFS